MLSHRDENQMAELKHKQNISSSSSGISYFVGVLIFLGHFEIAFIRILC